jgi:hypothetical protein
MKLLEKLKNLLSTLVARTTPIQKKKAKRETYKCIEYSGLSVEAFISKYQYPATSAHSDLYGVVLAPILVDYYGNVVTPLIISVKDSDGHADYV